MRFMMIIKSDAKAEAGVLPDEKLLSAMGGYNEALMKAGVLLGADGLQASSKGVRVRLSGKKTTVTDGPFAEAKELVAGFWLIQVKSKEEAIEWAKRVPAKEGEVELRPLFELSDLPSDPTEKPDGWRDQEQQTREAWAATGPVRQAGTTRYLVALKSNRFTESGALPDQKILTAMGGLMDELARSGALLGGEGLKPSSKGARVQFSGDKRTVIDGPFTEAKEMIAGYTIIQVRTREEAIEFAKRWLQIHVEGLAAEAGEIEIRPFLEKPDGWRQQEQRMRESLGK
jgi:hypothetical protein